MGFKALIKSHIYHIYLASIPDFQLSVETPQESRSSPFKYCYKTQRAVGGEFRLFQAITVLFLSCSYSGAKRHVISFFLLRQATLYQGNGFIGQQLCVGWKPRAQIVVLLILNYESGESQRIARNSCPCATYGLIESLLLYWLLGSSSCDRTLTCQPACTERLAPTYGFLNIIAPGAICLVIVAQKGPRAPECNLFKARGQCSRHTVVYDTLSIGSLGLGEHHYAVAHCRNGLGAGLDRGWEI